MTRKLTLWLSLVLPLAAANVAGKWSLPRQGPPGRPSPPAVLMLNQAGNRVTGSVTPPRGVSTGSPANTEVWDGKVDGDTLTFYLWTGLDQPVKQYYEGKIGAEEITFTVTVDRPAANQPKSTQVNARRIP